MENTNTPDFLMPSDFPSQLQKMYWFDKSDAAIALEKMSDEQIQEKIDYLEREYEACLCFGDSSTFLKGRACKLHADQLDEFRSNRQKQKKAR